VPFVGRICRKLRNLCLLAILILQHRNRGEMTNDKEEQNSPTLFVLMETTIAEIEQLKVSRALAFELIFRELKIFSRRANLPEDRIALAELEREILTVEQRWRTAGLVDELPEEEEPAA
jgi:hypothetical protein